MGVNKQKIMSLLIRCNSQTLRFLILELHLDLWSISWCAFVQINRNPALVDYVIYSILIICGAYCWCAHIQINRHPTIMYWVHEPAEHVAFELLNGFSAAS